MQKKSALGQTSPCWPLLAAEPPLSQHHSSATVSSELWFITPPTNSSDVLQLPSSSEWSMASKRAGGLGSGGQEWSKNSCWVPALSCVSSGYLGKHPRLEYEADRGSSLRVTWKENRKLAWAVQETQQNTATGFLFLSLTEPIPPTEAHENNVRGVRK